MADYLYLANEYKRYESDSQTDVVAAVGHYPVVEVSNEGDRAVAEGPSGRGGGTWMGKKQQNIVITIRSRSLHERLQPAACHIYRKEAQRFHLLLQRCRRC